MEGWRGRWGGGQCGKVTWYTVHTYLTSPLTQHTVGPGEWAKLEGEYERDGE